MKNKSAILVGVGGQGAILTAKVLVNGLMKAGYDVKMSEVHGMSQRGGSVSTQVHWGEKVWSPVIGEGAADLMLAFEKMEAVRYAHFLKPDGIAVINDYEMPSSTVAAGLEEYPEGCLEAMKANFRCFTLDAAEIALGLGSARCMNIVLFGAMTRALALDGIDWEQIIRETVPPKFLELNLAAYRAGRAAVEEPASVS
jgi:indolepyruvate ferredoxin oxidoreductase beta subunit